MHAPISPSAEPLTISPSAEPLTDEVELKLRVQILHSEDFGSDKWRAQRTRKKINEVLATGTADEQYQTRQQEAIEEAWKKGEYPLAQHRGGHDVKSYSSNTATLWEVWQHNTPCRHTMWLV